jgi:ATP adenylyltransferase/5',5'''-P-1,P-4-tetraphosphate phosphorylase II
LISRITDEKSLDKAATSLEQLYLSCLQRLENPKGHGPYNFVVNKDWVMMVNRSRPYFGQTQIQINSLGYLGLLYAKS